MKHNPVQHSLYFSLCITLSCIVFSASLVTAGVPEMSAIHGAVSLGNGKLLVATDNGIVLSDARSSTSSSQLVSHLNVQSLALSTSAKVIAAASDGSVYMSSLDAREWRKIRTSDITSVGSEAAVSLMIDRDNIIYLCRVGHGVDRSVDDGATWSSLSDVSRQPSDFTCMTVDAMGNVFVGTESRGILRFNEQSKRWEPLQLVANRLPYVESLCVLSDGSIIAGGSNDVYRSSDMGKNWLRTQLFDSQSGTELSSVDGFGTRDNSTIVALSTQGVFESTDGGTVWHAVTASSSKDDAKEYVCIGSRLCAKTQHGIVRVSRWNASQPQG